MRSQVSSIIDFKQFAKALQPSSTCRYFDKTLAFDYHSDEKTSWLYWSLYSRISSLWIS